MVNGFTDQAEGLRRMLGVSRARTIAVVGGTRGAGTTSCVVNLAAALARQGRRVVIVDENYDSNVAKTLGLRPRYDLRDAIEGHASVSDVLLHANGVLVLPAANAVRALPKLDIASQNRAVDCFAELDDVADIVLLDTRNDAAEPSAFAAAAQEVIVVVSSGAASITGGYAAVKRMNKRDARTSFRLLVNRTPGDHVASLVYNNMHYVSKTHLGVELEFMGAIPQDPAVSDSTRRFAAAVDAAPVSTVSQRFCEHAGAMLRWDASQDDVSRLDTFMQRAIYGSRTLAAGAGA